MEKVKEKTKKYEVSILLKANGYYLARMSLKLGGGPSQRLEKSGTTEELALLNLLNNLMEYIDGSFNCGLITCKFDDRIPQRLVASINRIGITTPEIMEKTLVIVNKINTINAHILNNISMQNNIVPFHSTNIVPVNNINNISVMPTQVNIVNNTTPVIHNINNEKELENTQEVLIKDFAMEWIKYKFSQCKKTEDNPKPKSKKTMDGYYRKLSDVIFPYCDKNKKMYLSQLTVNVIEDLIKGVKGSTSKRHTYIILNMLFNYAIKKKGFQYNPMKKIDKPVEATKTEEEKSSDFIDPDKQNEWLDIFERENTDMSILFFTMLLTGLRPEEACGLKWKALDLENGELVVNNAYKDFIVYNENMEPIGHKRHDDRLKTPESYRRIPLNPRLIEVLLKHMENQKIRFSNYRQYKNSGRKWSKNDYMFLGRTYQPYVSDTLSSALRDFCIEKDLQRITPYTLRRSFATFCAERGMEEIVLMRLMGHSSFQTTQKYYIRVSSKRKRLAMQEAYKVVFYERKVS